VTSIQKVSEDHGHIPERPSASEQCYTKVYIYIGQQSFAGPYIHVYFGYTARPTVFTPRIQKSRRRKSNSWPVVSTHEKSGKD